jgi:hypothetical protein
VFVYGRMVYVCMGYRGMGMGLWAYVCVYVNTPAITACVYVYMCICVYVYMCVCVYMCMCVCVYGVWEYMSMGV